MPRRLPPLNALRAFEAAARYESFTRAAEELRVTQGAVSHQVKALEAELGVRLFNRERQRLIITEAGRSYLAVVRDAFDRIDMGTQRLLQRQGAGVLTVSTSPNFAAKWLVHRLGRFAQAYPDIDLRVSASLHHVDFAREDIDLAIRHSEGPPSELHMTRLCAEELFPVCNPMLLKDGQSLETADLGRLTLLHVNDRQDWSRWLQAAGVIDIDLSRGPVLNQTSMAIDAAVDGQGIALARTALAAWDLISGRLIRPFAISLPVSYAYWIVCPKATAKLPKIESFSSWLLSEAAEDARQLQDIARRPQKKTRGKKPKPGLDTPCQFVRMLISFLIQCLSHKTFSLSAHAAHTVTHNYLNYLYLRPYPSSDQFTFQIPNRCQKIAWLPNWYFVINRNEAA